MPELNQAPVLSTVWFSPKERLGQLVRFLMQLGEKRQHPWTKKVGKAFGEDLEPVVAYWLARKHTVPQHIENLEVVQSPQKLFRFMLKYPALRDVNLDTLAVVVPDFLPPRISTLAQKPPQKPFSMFLYPLSGRNAVSLAEALAHEGSHVYDLLRKHKAAFRNYPGNYPALSERFHEGPEGLFEALNFLGKYSDIYNPRVPYKQRREEIFSSRQGEKFPKEMMSFLHYASKELGKHTQIKKQMAESPKLKRGVKTTVELADRLTRNIQRPVADDLDVMVRSPQWRQETITDLWPLYEKLSKKYPSIQKRLDDSYLALRSLIRELHSPDYLYRFRWPESDLIVDLPPGAFDEFRNIE